MEMEKSERLSNDHEPIPTECLPGEWATRHAMSTLGSVRKMNAEAALPKARWMKGEALLEHYLFNSTHFQGPQSVAVGRLEQSSREFPG